ncbi:DNA repair protein RecN [Fodinisporobacter ferrooxydans]|uniref:DNA repair protein RecN n=1 Tax=Fodinisporobacter ferrooxydans TaxID=2901836 RepID=A0ABY4CI04_9BACL|nr:DNA repair protein RecN [Alicyclobacillaceae bacterium MYW30-H2]
MLQELYVRNFALIEEVRIRFSSGLNILTGETGAGKSIVLDAIGMIMGGRASADFVRTGCDKAIVEASFDVEKEMVSSIAAICEQYGIDWDFSQSFILVREISASGKTTSRCNGRLVTTQALRQLTESLIHVHGQHEHQTLQHGEEQLTVIDQFGGESLEPLIDKMKQLYDTYASVKTAYEKAKMGEKERQQRIDMLSFQVNEIESIGIKSGEEEQLETEKKRLASAERLYSAASNTYDLLYSGASGGRQKSLLELIHQTVQTMQNVKHLDEPLETVGELLQSAELQLEEATFQLREYRDKIEFNPSRLDVIEDRLAAYHRLQKKYGANAEEILAYLETIRAEYNQLLHHDQTLAEFEIKIREMEKSVAHAAKQLSEQRKRFASQLEKRMETELQALMMPRTQFSIRIEEVLDKRGILIEERNVRVSSSGIDHVEFLFSPNPGEPLRALSKIASGGELSRTMLALKTVLADRDGIPTLIFDEVDTGISGRAAQSVAERLAILAKSKQVLCVTHLPQVACMADTHFLIAKFSTADRTRTDVTPLSQEQQVEELARMLSGAELTDTTRQHALEMLHFAKEVKAS